MEVISAGSVVKELLPNPIRLGSNDFKLLSPAALQAW